MAGFVIRAALLVVGVALAVGCHAQPPEVGGWRRVSDSDLERQFHFSMLPHAAAAGSRWAVYDAKAGKVVCCLSVESAEVGESELQDRFDIPGPWVTDLTNGWNLDAAPYRPHVQLLKVQGAMSSYTFKEEREAAGGLLLPPDARAVGANILEIAGERYTVQRRETSLADGDGGVHTYTLKPSKGGAALKIEVPFGTY
ncbi:MULTISPECIES: hypothetical protein [Stenotrophomonas]|uniref:Decarboxylase n=1 Tax=Stenotrophomonas maltophilia TaxID=40324 RepID=A0AAI9FTX1_STEMA|nr:MULTISPECIES: hypothetical protein [Stenotrophomonas]UUS14039.1 hypothetical protein NMB32_19635 [Stenotrophomonas sp. CD2]AWT15204.1 hypothetical protein DM611_13450 [Stenotrophomonas maltophilia]EKT4094193.1 hypothetical protein [Stenotrophomonas maltophilia]ELF4098685.1 hypothetical protein [Stenotrophomonas maltophilia]MBA0361886.1 hypothetical protein [Stenotrophomonas maltophilia]